MRGRKPKPTPLKVLQGNPGKRKINKDEPTPEPGLPDPPAWLIPEALEEWNRVTAELGALGVLTRLDGGMLAIYCQLYGQFVVAQKTRQEVTAAMIAQIRALAANFGLTPSDRTRLRVPEKEQRENPWTDLF